MLKYGILAKAMELLCFKSSLTRLAELQPDIGGITAMKADSCIVPRRWRTEMNAVISM